MQPSTSETTAKTISGDFLQSVVLVDDEAEFAALHGVESDEHTGAQQAARPRRTRKPPLKVPTREHANRLDAKLVADGFAEKGIVCGILQPGRNETEVAERTVTVARRADILVLDWDFYGDNGETALRLLLAVLQEDKQDRRRRLIAIYTAEPSLRKIAAKIHDELRRKYGRGAARRLKSFTIDAGVGRIVVYAKPDSRIPTTNPATRKRIVAYKALPDVLIADFAEWTRGLVSNVAIKSLAALRANTHQLLKKLAPTLDAAYLWHRSVQSDPDDAEDHLVGVVTAEFRSILDDADVRSAASLSAIKHWLEDLEVGDFAAQFGEDSGKRSVQDVLDLVRVGTSGETDESKQVIQRFSKFIAKKAHERTANIAGFARSAAAAVRANEEFAVLTSLRTQYGRPTPRMTLGTIVSTGKGAGRRYYVCLQPRCDSVRLRGAESFPMLPLEPSAGEGAFHVVLPASGRRVPLRLTLKAKPRRLEMIRFAASSPSACVIAEADSRGGFRFQSVKNRWYRWEGELKFDHAQRLAEMLAREFSRVGLTESEWLRLWGK